MTLAGVLGNFWQCLCRYCSGFNWNLFHFQIWDSLYLISIAPIEGSRSRIIRQDHQGLLGIKISPQAGQGKMKISVHLLRSSWSILCTHDSGQRGNITSQCSRKYSLNKAGVILRVLLSFFSICMYKVFIPIRTVIKFTILLFLQIYRQSMLFMNTLTMEQIKLNMLQWNNQKHL